MALIPKVQAYTYSVNSWSVEASHHDQLIEYRLCIIISSALGPFCLAVTDIASPFGDIKLEEIIKH